MPDKHYIYDSEGRRQLEAKKLLEYYAKERDYYVEIAQELYRTIAQAGAAPLQGDVFVMMFSALKANARFVQDLLDRGVNLDRGANKWFCYFAWLVVLENWTKIRKK